MTQEEARERADLVLRGLYSFDKPKWLKSFEIEPEQHGNVTFLADGTAIVQVALTMRFING